MKKLSQFTQIQKAVKLCTIAFEGRFSPNRHILTRMRDFG